MQRRHFIAGTLAASVSVLTGCTESGDGAGDGTTTTRETTEETTEETTTTETTTETATTETTTATTTEGTAGETTSAPPMADRVVEMEGTSFVPAELEIGVGDTVMWLNKDSFAHDVTSAQFSDAAATWEFSKTLGDAESTRHTFDSEGVYEYYCTIHGEQTMCGVVLAGDVDGGTLPCDDAGDDDSDDAGEGGYGDDGY